MAVDNRTLAELLHYSRWASSKLLDFAITVPEEDVNRAIPNSHGGILKTFQHIYYADRVWLARMEQAAVMPFEDPAPGPSLQELQRDWWPLLDRFAAWVATNDPERVMTFRRLNGEAMEMVMYQIVQHVANHGTYHRGQIAAMLKQSGHTPPSTDLLFYYRDLGVPSPAVIR